MNRFSTNHSMATRRSRRVVRRGCRMLPPRRSFGGVGRPRPTSGQAKWWVVSVLIALTFASPVVLAQDYGNDKPPPPVPEVSIPLTPAEKATLHAIEVRLVGVEALAAKIDDPKYQASVQADIGDMKKRHAALEKKYDAGPAEALMHSVISRYQIVALWLRPAPLPSAAKPGAVATPPAPRRAPGAAEPAKTGSQ